MTVCPIAIAVGCQKCPVFKICPAKSLLGDVPKVDQAKPVAAPTKSKASKPAHKTAAKKAASRKKTS